MERGPRPQEPTECVVPRARRAGRRRTRPLWPLALVLAGLFVPAPVLAQGAVGAGGGAAPVPDSLVSDSLPAGASGAPADSVAPPEPGLPLYAVLGLGFGSRSDACVLCETPQDNKSFTGHLSLGRPLGDGIGIGLDVSIWRKGRPGTPLAADSTGIPVATSLTNMLGNVSVSFSYQFWRLFVRAGGGLAFGSQDLEMTGTTGDILIHTASGWGVGYSAGGGFTVPLASMVSLAFFGNWNVGQYDMVSPQGLTEREAKHQYLELGVGLAVR